MTQMIAATTSPSPAAKLAQSSRSLSPRTGWPKFLGLYSSMVHVSQADIVTCLAVTTQKTVIAIPYYEPGRTGPTYYLPTARVAPNQSPRQAASAELLRATGFTSTHWHMIGRLLVEIDKRVATTYLFLALEAANSIDALPDTTQSASPDHLPLDGIEAMLNEGAFPVEVHALALVRALKHMASAPPFL